MEKFKIPVTWEVCGEVEVEAESLDEAVEMVDFDPDEITVPEKWEIVEGSLNTNYELAEILNPGHKLSEELYPSEIDLSRGIEKDIHKKD